MKIINTKLGRLLDFINFTNYKNREKTNWISGEQLLKMLGHKNSNNHELQSQLILKNAALNIDYRYEDDNSLLVHRVHANNVAMRSSTPIGELYRKAASIKSFDLDLDYLLEIENKNIKSKHERRLLQQLKSINLDQSNKDAIDKAVTSQINTIGEDIETIWSEIRHDTQDNKTLNSVNSVIEKCEELKKALNLKFDIHAST